jgi:2-methylcitrate dehydratase PrpD
VHTPFSNLSDTLRWLCETPVPADVHEHSRFLFLDTLGCYLSGINHPEVARVIEVMGKIEPGPVRLPGLKCGLSVSAAAYVFAMAACWDEACEGLARAHGRPGVATLASALAVGLARGGTIGDLLGSLTLGYEVSGRLGEIMRIRPGMHVDATFPSFGSAAAAAAMLGLGAPQIHQAIQTAAIQMPCSLYLPIKVGSNSRNTFLAHAATLGIQSALVVSAGVAPPKDALDSAYEITLGHSIQDSTKSLVPKGTWLIKEGYFKPYAAVRHVHYGAAAAALLREQWLGRSDWEHYELEIYEEATVYCGNRSPLSTIQAQFSLSWGVAAMLVLGDLGPLAFGAEALANPEIRRIEALLKISPVAALGINGRRAARLHVASKDESLLREVDAVKGDLANPMLPEDLVPKFIRYATAKLGEPGARSLCEAIRQAQPSATIDQVLSLK